MTTTLYEIANIREALDSVIAENEGVLDEQLEAALAQVDGDFEEKAERCGLWVREQLAAAEAIGSEMSRLGAKRTAAINRAKRVQDYLFAQMQRVGKTRVNGLLCQLVITKNPPSVVEKVPLDEETLRNIAKIANGLYVRRVPETFTLDKTAIKAQAKAGTLDEDMAKYVAVVTDKMRLDVK